MSEINQTKAQPDAIQNQQPEAVCPRCKHDCAKQSCTIILCEDVAAMMDEDVSRDLAEAGLDRDLVLCVCGQWHYLGRSYERDEQSNSSTVGS